MAGVMQNLDTYVSKLEDSNHDIKAKLQYATDLRDNIELWCQGDMYKVFLQKLMPVFLNVLDGQPVFISNLPEQRLRNTVLEILHRLPMSPPEVLEEYAAQVVDRLMSLVRIENEDNAVLCMKIIMDFQRHLTKVLADRVQPFLELIQEMFEMMEQAVRDTFDSPAANQHPPQGAGSAAVPSTPNNPAYSQSPRPGSPVASTSDLGAEQQQARPLLKGMQSFKVLSECPIIVVSIFQAYRSCVAKNVKLFVPLIKNALLLQAKPQEKAHAEAKAQGRIFTGVSKEIKNRAAFGDLITAQVKTMSFLAYLLRVYAQQLTDFLPTLPDIVVRLLKDCPREKSGARKELLVAIRHIINFNFRRIFLKKIDELLDERTLIGDGLTVYETMRPLAYSMLADLIHHLRDQLSRDQIRRTVEVYTKNLHDNFPGTSFQTMSAKLLLNMAECIARLEPKRDARHFLIMILNAIGDKFAAMNRQYHNAIKLSEQYSHPTIDAVAENYFADKDQPPEWDEIDIFTATPIKTSNPRDRNSEPIADNKFLFKNLLHGLKNLFYQLRACNPSHIKDQIDPQNAPPNWGDVSFGYNAEEVEVLIKLFREGARVFRYYGLDNKQHAESHGLSPSELLANQHMMSSDKVEKELLETFATVFHHIDPATFHEVFQSEIPNLYEMMFDHPSLLHVPQFLLASEATSPAFAGMLLQFLMGKIDEVGTADVRKSSILLRLFKLSFMAVTLFSTQNEQVLLPHVTKIVTKSIQLSTTAEEPTNYFLLLRSLFRSIGGGRFEHLYKEILPLLEMLLEVLNNLLMAARKPQDRDLFVELSLTVPARLSNLLPHLNYLMRPLVVALRAGSDLIGQGLRTLELCVDNLTADYLDPIMAPVIDDLMAALWEHLKPNPYSHFHSHTTMRILGKLGGRNRKFLNGPPDLTYKPFADDESSIDIRLIGSGKDRAFPANIGIDLAISKLMEVPKQPAAKKSDRFHKEQAFKLITSHLKLLMGQDDRFQLDEFMQLLRLQAADLANGRADSGEDLMAVQDRDKSLVKRDVQQETMKKLLKTCIFACSIPELRADASRLLQNVSRHFTMLEIGRTLVSIRHTRKPFDVHSGEGPNVIDSRVIADAVGDSFSSDNIEVREAAEQVLVHMHETASAMFSGMNGSGGPGKSVVEKLPLFSHVAKVLAHNCFEEEWFTKAGGTTGINIMITKLGLSDAWMVEQQLAFVRALMYVMKDMPEDVTAKVRIQARDTLEVLIRRCNKSATNEDLKNPQSKIFHLCGFLVYELAHMNKHVRFAAQHCFAVIAEVVGVETHELMLPVKDRLLQPIFNKPLRALPFPIQIGYIDAITFCLKVKHNLVEFDQQLTRLVMESLVLADADDESLTSKPHEHRNAEAIVNLRVACLRLLTTAQSFPEFSALPPNSTRARIIAIFFKSLYSKSPEVVEAAHTGLQGVLSATNKLPKDLLQNGLRPILLNLQDPKKLTVEGLDGLARLLKLLTNYFKVEIGTRLLDQLKNIADGPTLQKVSFTLVEQNRQMGVVTAIFNIFHLLPPAALSFLYQLVKKVVELEAALRRTRDSPFREPLIMYLSHYPKEAWDYFAPLIQNITFGRFFAQIIAHPSSEPLRQEVAKDPEKFIKSFSNLEDEKERWPAVINAIHVAYSFCAHPTLSQKGGEDEPEWLVANYDVRKALFDSAKGLETKLRANVLEPELRLAAEQAGEQVVRVFMAYLSHNPTNIDYFFEIVDAVTADELKHSPSIFQFIYKHLICSESVEFWRAIIHRCIESYTTKSTSQKTKTFLFRNVLNPIIAMDVQRNWDRLFVPGARGTKLMDKNMTELIHVKLWRPQAFVDPTEYTGQLGVDHSRMELLQLTALLLKYHSTLIADSRKDIIKFGWNYIKLEDIINKHAAYVVTGYFIAQYDTPSKIAMQVYTAMLRAHQNEGRALVMQALELLAPILQKRIGTGEFKMPLWARIPRKILAEESSNLQQLLSIFNFLVRHPDLFYEARESLAQIIIPSMNKIAPLPNPSNENKKIALNLTSMIWNWEERAAQEHAAAGGGANSNRASSQSPQGQKRKADGTIVPSQPETEGNRYVAPPAIRKMLLKYLVHFVVTVPERYPILSQKTKEANEYHGNQSYPQSCEAVKKAVYLLTSLLSEPYWSDLDLEGIFPRMTEPVLTSDKKEEEKLETWITRTVNSLQIVKVIVNVKSDDWVFSNLDKLQRLCEKPFRAEIVEIQDALHSEEPLDGIKQLQPLVRRILSVIPDPIPEEGVPPDAQPGATEKEAKTGAPPSGAVGGSIESFTLDNDFVNFCGAVVTEALSNNHYISAVNLLWTLCQRKPEEVDQHITPVMRALQSKLAKDHLQSYNGIPGQPPPLPQMRPAEPPKEGSPEAHELEIQTGLILKIIDLLAARIAQLGEQRRPYLSVLASLVERSQSMEICLKILDLVEGWIFRSTEPVPTLKEKTAVLHKMLLFEHRPDSNLLKKFLELVIRIYEDPKITRSELTVRMEHAFLIGTRAQDVEMRNRFMAIFDKSLSRTSSNRLSYVISSQNWDTLGESYWLSQVIHLMFGSIEMSQPAQLHPEDFKLMPISRYLGTNAKDPRLAGLMSVDDEFEAMVVAHSKFSQQELGDIKVRDVFEPLRHLQHTDSWLAHDIWLAFFPLCWSALTKDEQSDLEKGMVALLTKEFHWRQLDKRPNCVQTLIEALVKATPRFKFPPHVLKNLAKTYNVWYAAATYMEESSIHPIIDAPKIRESNLDALLDLYSTLQEDDLFYGVWRRRCDFLETNIALSYEQNGMWDNAQRMYEQAQIRSRTGGLPFSQGEYMLWEDHWVICAQKLQQWEILADFAKHENFNDLYLESTWRNFDAWQNAESREQLDSIIKSVSDAPTPRRVFWQAFMTLLKLYNNYKTESPTEFNRICDEAVQLSIRKWHQLPKRITNAHIPILQSFQQLVELHDANVICSSLAQTAPGNLDMKSQELKLLLGTWRDRLPNFWDDINAWQDLVTWRQHIFQLINHTYLQLLPQQGGAPGSAAGNAAGGNSYAYRGYHETAWIINRFAHVARKHNLPDVCINQLGRIYTLPNIEIQEAFLKLREQAKCHYRNPTELNSGLDVINNTNLNYFGQNQKAEFYTLKGMFLNKLGQKNEANDAFGSALYFDIKLPKAWAEWGHYNDALFKEDPGNLEKASSAISCYLEAASQYKNAKSRKLLGRILWLLSLDNSEHVLSNAFEEFKGDTPIWYWITYIPQLLTSLSRPEAHIAREILSKIAKNYPQALYFHLRTSREDMHTIRKQQEQKEAREKQVRARQQGGQGSPSIKQQQQGSPDSRPQTANGATPQQANGENAAPKVEGTKDQSPTNDATGGSPKTPKKPWEHTEEIMSALKTAFPLLALSMETMVDQIQKHFKCPPDEDAYRLIVALLNDGLSYVGRQPASYSRDVKLPPTTEANITRFAESVLPAHIRKTFEADFVAKKPTMFEYIQKLRTWRARFEERLDRRSPKQSLEGFSAHLSEFRFQKFDDVEVPGQYLEHRDKNADFVKIERFLPNVDLVRGVAVCHRRLKIRGHDGSMHSFAVQHPAARHCRREERILQLFRIFNSVLLKRKESRRRNIQFHLPLMIPLSPSVRLVQDDASYISLQGIYEDHCRRNGINKDEPILFAMEKLSAINPVSPCGDPGRPELSTNARPQKEITQANNIRVETFIAVQEQFVPPTVVLDYFRATFPNAADFWLFHKTAAYQLAALTFMTYIFHMNMRYPHKMSIARGSGRIWGSELIPAMAAGKPFFHNPEQVPFRYSPNLQTLLGPVAAEGIFAPTIMVIARCLAEPDGELDMQLSIFVRDEMTFWFTQQHRTVQEGQLRDTVQTNSDIIVKRVQSLATPAMNLPANQTVIDLIAAAANVQKLAQTDPLWMAYL
ncbi:hypothetical protein BDY21DRAFT_71272 [Lineolata rhizophorae]|uniref:Non-specific serine/threonine protein kinase n=1 Tax=Lineolata rhizophorae TaxID=578093 RepID=A0A6A6NW83_9PEZI|nr:hypothetical protein BDY21DRAFT_71272 [Lineolata rhizophorae]